MPSIDPMTSLAKQLNVALRSRFGDAMTGYVVRELQEGDDPWMRAAFLIYEYWEIDFLYDRGSFGFSIPFRNAEVSVIQGPREGQTIADLDAILDELDGKVRSRIPDKYLEEWDRTHP